MYPKMLTVTKVVPCVISGPRQLGQEEGSPTFIYDIYYQRDDTAGTFMRCITAKNPFHAVNRMMKKMRQETGYAIERKDTPGLFDNWERDKNNMSYSIYSYAEHKPEPFLPDVVLNHSIILLATGISMSRYGERYLNCIEINNAGGYDGVRAYPVAYCNKGQTFSLKSGESFEDAFTRFAQEYPTYIFLDAREHYNQMPEPETIDETKRVEVYVDGELVFDSLD